MHNLSCIYNSTFYTNLLLQMNIPVPTVLLAESEWIRDNDSIPAALTVIECDISSRRSVMQLKLCTNLSSRCCELYLN